MTYKVFGGTLSLTQLTPMTSRRTLTPLSAASTTHAVACTTALLILSAGAPHDACN